jgi:hypothetical protein
VKLRKESQPTAGRLKPILRTSNKKIILKTIK